MNDAAFVRVPLTCPYRKPATAPLFSIGLQTILLPPGAHLRKTKLEKVRQFAVGFTGMIRRQQGLGQTSRQASLLGYFVEFFDQWGKDARGFGSDLLVHGIP
jgi:hypothetical protein